jgi:hypothetical protein
MLLLYKMLGKIVAVTPLVSHTADVWHALAELVN